MSFRFSVPTVDASANIGAHLRPRQAKPWIDSLPLGDVIGTARAIYTSLYASNRARLDDDDRFKLLEIYRPRLLRVLSELGREYSEATLPLPEQAREAANLSRDLLIEYAYGYKLILLEKANKLLLFSAKRQFPLLLYRAICTLADTLSLSYKTYTPTPAGVWHEIHQIYHYAQFYSMEDQSVDEEEGPATSTISVVYKQTLLLALADPYRLMPGEVDKVLNIIAHFSGGVIIMPYSPDLTGAGLFLLQSDGDRPPKGLASVGNMVISPIDKVVSTANLAFTLSELVSQLDSGVPAKTLALPLTDSDGAISDLLRRLARAWSTPPRRVYARQPVEAKVELCAGIKALAHFLTVEQDPAWLMEKGRLQKVTTIPLAVAANDGEGPTASIYPISHCEILNQSASGLALRTALRGEPVVTVGEIIGVKFPGQPTWNVGAVRWVQTNDAHEIEIGVQLVAPTATPVMVEPATGTTVRKQDGLLLPPVEALKQPAYLLAPRDCYKDNQELKIEQRDSIERVRATRLIEQTTAYDLFAFAAA
jgi:cyclic-di-GMP-binding protein